jgi:hypothetical protein
MFLVLFVVLVLVLEGVAMDFEHEWPPIPSR